jgi:hypothetical protein
VHARDHVATLCRVPNLQGAFGRRAAIEQAKGILMARHAIDQEKAFDILGQYSQRGNRKLIEVAEAIVQGHVLLPPSLLDRTGQAGASSPDSPATAKARSPGTRALHDAVHAGDGAAAEQADRVILARALREILATFEHTSSVSEYVVVGAGAVGGTSARGSSAAATRCCSATPTASRWRRSTSAACASRFPTDSSCRCRTALTSR